MPDHQSDARPRTQLPLDDAIAHAAAPQAPRDQDFPGTIVLTVDATDVRRGIFDVRELIPVPAAGPMTLLYPKWLPGYHSPQSPISLLAGLEITGSGERLHWRRDLVEVHAFHVEVPDGVRLLEARFQFLSPTSTSQGRIMATDVMLNLQWNTVILYPAGYYSRRIQVAASALLPEGWQVGCALRSSRDGSLTRFETASLDVLIDSPVFAGRHFRRVDLDERGLVRLNIVADRPDQLEATADQIAPHRALVEQADKLFGARHFDHYDFLVALSDELGSIGVEHHRSCETATTPDYFREWAKNAPSRDVMAHEYTHSWNGKYRRGADSWTSTFEQPIRNSLMWVYEGLTQYWGNVLSARSGLWTAQNARDSLARTAAIYAGRAGRRWRSVSDTTGDPIIAGRSPLPWLSWQRSEDYYSEGQLLWLEVDTLIREISGDSRSLDDFARGFFGGQDGCYVTSTYQFADVVQGLTQVAQHDWAGFLTSRVESRDARSPLGGLSRGGYALVYRETPSEFALTSDAQLGVTCLRFSIGLTVAKNGTLQEVLWESPAFTVGLTAGSTLLAVNGSTYSHEQIQQAIVEAQRGAPLELLVKSGKRHRTVVLDYRDGHRYPHLEALAGARRRLDEILSPR